MPGTNPIPDITAHREALARDGVVCIRQGFDADEMRRIEDAFEWTMAHPGPGASKRYTDEPGTFYETTGHSWDEPPYKAIFEHTRVRELVSGLYAGRPAWYLGEQLFYKHGDAVRRTPWHQDLSYLNFRGDSVIGIWISLGDLPKAACLEFVRGSHRGPLYNGASYIDPADDTHPLYPDSTMPRLPAVEKERDRWDILSWDLTRGDLLVFHLGTLHGGGGTVPGVTRKSLTLRFFSDDAVWTEPLPAPDPEAFSVKRNKAWAESGKRGPSVSVVPGEPMHRSGRFRSLG
jgi:ectoine hydroxylase-related dioxygenase (phytanoyl-CoA dioxygenase family)